MAAGADTSPGTGASRALNDYWTKGKGLARWANSPTPYRALVAALLAAGVPASEAHGLAAEYYKKVFGHSPGKQRGDKH